MASNTPISISILKPLKGADPELYAALRSHCAQDYQEYEVLFGISDQNDPAAKVAETLVREFPERKLRLVLCDKKLGANGKVSTLAQLTPAATHELLLVNDSDICVDPQYLRTIARALENPDVGLVTCLYRGIAGHTFGSKLEALSISTDFAPGVLAAWLLERGLHFGLGSTLAFRRRDLQAMGGFEAIADYLADDYELGARIAQHGMKIELSSIIVETHLPAYDFGGFFAHQLRWARTIRASRPGGYAGLLITFTIPWAIATLALARGAPWAWWFLAAALAARFAVALKSTAVLQDSPSRRFVWMLPLRDFLGLGVWIAGWAGDKILWRGELFRLEHGKLRRE